MASPLSGGGVSAATVALFLDRDGVINEKAPNGRYIEDRASFRFIPGVIEALMTIHTAAPEIALLVVTNQRGIATRALTEGGLRVIHDGMVAELRRNGVTLDGIYVCPHERDSCDCRKPRSGLLHRARIDFPALRFAHSRLVGDALADLQAASSVGMPSFLVGHARSRPLTLAQARSKDIPVAGEADDLLELVRGEEMTRWLADVGSAAASATPQLAVH